MLILIFLQRNLDRYIDALEDVEPAHNPRLCFLPSPNRIVRTMKNINVPNMIVIKTGKKVTDKGCAVAV